MLKPYVCIACEKVILEQPPENPLREATAGIASLISLFSKIIVSIRTGQEAIPANALAPKEWAVFSAWDVEPEDEHKEYYICMQGFYPDGTPFGEKGRMRVNIEPSRRSQVVFRMLGFPIGQMGMYKVQTWIEEHEKTVVGPIEFGIEVVIHRQSENAGTS